MRGNHTLGMQSGEEGEGEGRPEHQEGLLMKFLEEAAGLGAMLGKGGLDLAFEDVRMPVPLA